MRLHVGLVLLVLWQRSILEKTEAKDAVFGYPGTEIRPTNSTEPFSTITEKYLTTQIPQNSTALSNSTDHISKTKDNHQTTQNSTKQHDSEECMTTRYMNWVSSTGFTIFGIGGNIVSIRILHKLRSKSSSSFLLSVLAVWDSMSLLIRFIIITSTNVLGAYMVYPSAQYVALSMWIYVYPCFAMAQSQSTYIIVLVSVHRFIAICYPHKTQRYCNHSIAQKQTVIVTAFVALITTPLFLTDQVVSKTNKFNNTMYIVEYTKLGGNVVFQLVYPGIIFMILVFFGPLLLLFVLVIYLIRAVRLANQNRLNMAGGEAALQDVTKMLVPLIIIFMFCQIWTRVRRFAEIAQVKFIWFLQCRIQMQNVLPVGLTVREMPSSASFYSFVSYLVLGRRSKINYCI